MKRNISIFLLSIFFAALPSVLAGTKEELVRLQSDVLALQNQIREFDKNYNERLEGLKSLVVQLNDQVARSQVVLDRYRKRLRTRLPVSVLPIRRCCRKFEPSPEKSTTLQRAFQFLRNKLPR